MWAGSSHLGVLFEVRSHPPWQGPDAVVLEGPGTAKSDEGDTQSESNELSAARAAPGKTGKKAEREGVPSSSDGAKSKSAKVSRVQAWKIGRRQRPGGYRRSDRRGTHFG